jgi:two-component system LytT family sensor kinase
VSDSRTLISRLQLVGLVTSVWLVFGALSTAIAISVEGRPGSKLWLQLLLNVILAIAWTGFTFVVAAWHQRLLASRLSAAQMVLRHVPLAVLVALTDAFILRAIVEILTGTHLRIPFIATAVYYADFDIVRYIAIVAVVDALLVRREVVQRQHIASAMERVLARARLDHLAAQLQPHFLFNALSAVSELAARAPHEAARVVRQLASIIQQARSTASVEVPLSVELAEIQPYLEIQRMRFADWLTIRCDASADALSCIVPRFILQPLVENAIRHGLAGRDAAGSIEIHAILEGNRLIVRVADNGVGLSSNQTPQGHQIGLANVRERLSILYGNEDRLVLRNVTGGGVAAELTLPARLSETIATNDAETLTTDESTRTQTSLVIRSRRQRALITLGVWAACGLLWAQQSFAYELLRDRLRNDNLMSIGIRDMTNGLIWAALTPLVFLLVKRFPISRRALVAKVVAYVVGSAAIGLLHTAILERLTNPTVPVWSPAYEGTIVVDFLIVVVLIGVAHRRQFVEWLAARELSAASLQSALEIARHTAQGLQSVFPVLLRYLEALAVRLDAKADDSEDIIAALGDYLRIAIETSGRDAMTPVQKTSLAAAELNVDLLMNHSAISVVPA